MSNTSKRTQDLSGTSPTEDTPISNAPNFHQACTCVETVDTNLNCPMHGESPETTLTTYSGDTSNRANTEPKRELAQPHPSNTEQELDALLQLVYDFGLAVGRGSLENDSGSIEEVKQELIEWRATHTAEAVRVAVQQTFDKVAVWNGINRDLAPKHGDRLAAFLREQSEAQLNGGSK